MDWKYSHVGYYYLSTLTSSMGWNQIVCLDKPNVLSFLERRANVDFSPKCLGFRTYHRHLRDLRSSSRHLRDLRMEVRGRFFDPALALLQESLTVWSLSRGILFDVYIVAGYLLFAYLLVSFLLL